MLLPCVVLPCVHHASLMRLCQAPVAIICAGSRPYMPAILRAMRRDLTRKNTTDPLRDTTLYNRLLFAMFMLLVLLCVCVVLCFNVAMMPAGRTCVKRPAENNLLLAAFVPTCH